MVKIYFRFQLKLHTMVVMRKKAKKIHCTTQTLLLCQYKIKFAVTIRKSKYLKYIVDFQK